jgi:hypothetical protein
MGELGKLQAQLYTLWAWTQGTGLWLRVMVPLTVDIFQGNLQKNDE